MSAAEDDETRPIDILDSPPTKKRKRRSKNGLLLEYYLERPNNNTMKALIEEIENSSLPKRDLDTLIIKLIETGFDMNSLIKRVKNKCMERDVSYYIKSLGLTSDEARALVMCTDPEIEILFRLWSLKGDRALVDLNKVYASFIRILLSAISKVKAVPLHMMSTYMFQPPLTGNSPNPRIRIGKDYTCTVPIIGTNTLSQNEDNRVIVVGQIFAHDVRPFSLCPERVSFIIEPFVNFSYTNVRNENILIVSKLISVPRELVILFESDNSKREMLLFVYL